MILNNIHIFKNTKKYKAQKKQDGYYFNGFEKFSLMINAENIEPFAKTLEEAIYHIERNANPKILFLDLSFRMHRILHMKL